MATALRARVLLRQCTRQRSPAGVFAARRFLETNASPAPPSGSDLKFDAPLLRDLQARGLIQSVAGNPEQLSSRLTASPSTPITSYVGADPTAPSLHIGHLLPLMNSLHLYLNGHNSIALVGNATVSIGDPTGRSTERAAQAVETQKAAGEKIWKQLEDFFERGGRYAEKKGYERGKFGRVKVVSNLEWLGGVTMLEFLKTVGRNVRVGQMLARDSVKARLESKEGLNFAEMTYQLLQSYDFYHLYSTQNCLLQLGGSDQFGNITAGIDLISRIHPVDKLGPPLGLTTPLLLSPTGEKLGKSAGNAVSLDLAPFKLYQYFLQSDDITVGTFLRAFTLLSLEEIESVMASHRSAPHERTAQLTAAEEIVHLLHGHDALQGARAMTRLMFPKSTEGSLPISAADILAANAGEPPLKLPRSEYLKLNVRKVVKTVYSEAANSVINTAIGSGGVSFGIGREKVSDPNEKMREEWLIDGRLLVVRVGKKVFLLEVVEG